MSRPREKCHRPRYLRSRDDQIGMALGYVTSLIASSLFPSLAGSESDEGFVRVLGSTNDMRRTSAPFYGAVTAADMPVNLVGDVTGILGVVVSP